MKKKWRPTKFERTVQGIARRRATKQLMQVPWDSFHKSYEEYLCWEALALWVRAVVETEGSAPSWLVATIKKRCPTKILLIRFVKTVPWNLHELLGCSAPGNSL